MFGLIKRFRGYLIMFVVVGAMGTVIWWLYSENGSLRSKNGQYESTIANYRATEQQREAVLKQQNDSIHNLQETEKQLKEQIKDANKKRRAAQKRYEQRIRDLAQEEVPKTCDGAMNYMLDKATGAKNDE